MFLLNLLGSTSASKNGHVMSVLDHLEELRWRLVRSTIAILLFSVVAFIFMPYLFQNVILAHAQSDFWTYKIMCLVDPALCVDKLNFTLQSRDLSGQFTTHIKAALIMGLISGFPYLVWEIWGYVKPALQEREIKSSMSVVSIVPFLFIIGVFFGYYVLAPLSVNFLANYSLDSAIQNQFDISSYVSTVIMLVLMCGLVFQLPILIYFLALAGIVTPQLLSKYRKHAIVAIIILAGVITPSPDMLSQIIVGIPIYLLYEISIHTAARIKKVTPVSV